MGWMAALALLVLFTVLLSVKRYNYVIPLDAAWLRNTPIAHRGLHTSQFDENSLGAFSNAVANGYAIELDVRLTKDGAVLIMHDNDLKRLFGVKDEVSNMTLAELKELRFPKSGETIPTLADAIALVDGRVPLLVDIKNFGLVGKLEEATLKALESYTGEYAYQSFDPLTCKWMRDHDKTTPVGLLLGELPPIGNRFVRNFKDNLISAIARPGLIMYQYDVMTDEITRSYRDHGVTVLGWPVYDDVLKDNSYLRYVDNVIFEIHPDRQ